MDSIEVGKKIRALRISERLTLEQLATVLKIKKNMLSNYELGKSAISADLLTKIADYFDVSLDLLSCRENTVVLSEKTEKECCVYAYLYSGNLNDRINRQEMLFTMALPDNYIGNGQYFGLKITDDSLSAKNIPFGAVAIARMQSVAHSGDVVIYTYKGEKAHYGVYSLINGNIVIAPCSSNSLHPTALFDANDEDFNIIGKITTVLFDLK